MTVARPPSGDRATVMSEGLSARKVPGLPGRPLRTSRRQPSGQALENHRHALATADAHRLQAERLVLGLEAVDQRAGDPGAGHAERVTDGDRSAVHVELVDVDVQVAVARDDLGGERLVDLDEVDVVDGHPGPLQGQLAGRYRAVTHDLRREAGDRGRDDPR